MLQLVTRMQMLNKGSGVISWRLRGQLAGLPVDIIFQSTFELDLITGRVCFCLTWYCHNHRQHAPPSHSPLKHHASRPYGRNWQKGPLMVVAGRDTL